MPLLLNVSAVVVLGRSQARLPTMRWRAIASSPRARGTERQFRHRLCCAVVPGLFALLWRAGEAAGWCSRRDSGDVGNVRMRLALARSWLLTGCQELVC